MKQNYIPLNEKSSRLDVARELIRMQIAQNKWMHEFEKLRGASIELCDPVGSKYALLYMARDLLGEPQDNITEKDHEDGFTRKDSWCRDGITSLFYDISLQDEPNIDELIGVIQDAVRYSKLSEQERVDWQKANP